jgi:hypothetical protein
MSRDGQKKLSLCCERWPKVLRGPRSAEYLHDGDVVNNLDSELAQETGDSVIIKIGLTVQMKWASLAIAIWTTTISAASRTGATSEVSGTTNSAASRKNWT